MGREIRMVPANWEHPRAIRRTGEDFREGYRPLHNNDYEEALEESRKAQQEWFENQKLWESGYYVNYRNERKPLGECFAEWAQNILEYRRAHGYKDYSEEEYQRCISGLYSYTDFEGEPPGLANPEDFMPSGDWFQLFETVSAGTPLSPPFENKEDLVHWLSNNKDYWGNIWSREGAENIVSSGSAPSMMIIDRKLYKPEDMHLVK